MMSILLVDDHEILRHGLKQLLAEMFPEAVFGEAGSIVQARSLLGERQWHLLLLDINLPDDPQHALFAYLCDSAWIDHTVLISAEPEHRLIRTALAAGADKVGAEDLLEDMQAGNLDYGRVIATPDMMGIVGRLGKVLGPKGLMPNPKLGTVTPNVADAVKAAKSGQIEFRVEKAGIIHGGIGKLSFSDDALRANFDAFVDAIVKAKPAGAKGKYLRKIGLSSSMGPGLKVDVSQVYGS